MSRRLAAIVALVVGAATLVLAVVLAVTEFPRGLGLPEHSRPCASERVHIGCRPHADGS